MSNDWQNGICGCLNDCGTCCLTYFCHCVVAGQNAEGVGESCALYGCLSLFNCVGIFTRASIRQKLREKYGIGVSIHNFCYYLICDKLLENKLKLLKFLFQSCDQRMFAQSESFSVRNLGISKAYFYCPYVWDAHLTGICNCDKDQFLSNQ